MTSEELIQEAQQSQADAIRVCQEVWKGSAGMGSVVFNGLSKIPHAASSGVVRSYILKFIEKTGLGGSNVETLVNILSKDSINRETEPLLLQSICSKYPDSLAPAIIFVSKGTGPGEITKLAEQTGLTGAVFADKVPKRNQMLRGLKKVLTENIAPWENELSVFFLNSLILKDELGPATELISSLKTIPSTFVTAVAEKGAKKHRDALLMSKSPNVLKEVFKAKARNKWPLEENETIDDLLLTMFRNPEISPDEKVSFFEDINLATLKKETKQEIGTTLAAMPSQKAFKKAVELFRQGEMDDIYSITSNFMFACADYEEIVELINIGRCLGRANPKFIEYVQTVTGDDTDLTGLDRMPIY